MKKITKATLMAGAAAAAISLLPVAQAQADPVDWDDSIVRGFVIEIHEATDVSYDMPAEGELVTQGIGACGQMYAYAAN